MARYSVRITTVAGVVKADLENATVESVSWDLNGWGEMRFTLPTFDPKCLQLTICNREPSFWHEVQVWRDGTLIWIGIPVRAFVDGPTSTFVAFGLLWYFSRWYVGPNVSQYLLNPSFETSAGGIPDRPANWPTNLCDAFRVVLPRLHGPHAMYLETTGFGLDAYSSQQFNFVHAGPPGEIITFDVAAWFFIPPATWSGPAYEERGLWVQSNVGAAVFDRQSVPINNESPRGEWTKALTKITVPTGATSTVAVRLYCPGVQIGWDAAAVRVSSYVGANGDMGTAVLQALASHGVGKATVNIGVAPAATSVSEDRRWLTEDHANIWQAMLEWPGRDISDIAMDWNAQGTTRTLRSYAPRKGSFKGKRTIWIDRDAGNQLLQWSGEVDLTRSTTAVRVIGQAGGNGPTREYGYAVDTSMMGGMVLEDSIGAPVEATIGGYQELADSELIVRKRPVLIPAVEVPADPYMADVVVGDTLTVKMDYGWVQDPGTVYRVVSMRLTPATERVTLTLNLP